MKYREESISWPAWAAFAVIVTIGFLFTPEAEGATKAVRSNVYGVMSSDRYAGCMVQIGEIPATAGLNCPQQSRSWLTMDCNGNWLPLNASANNLRMAQLALLTGDKITVTVDDTKKANGYCLAKQIIIFK